MERREPVKEFTPAYMTFGTPERRSFEASVPKRDRDILAALPLLQRVQTHETLSIAMRDLCDVAERLIPGWRPPKRAIGGNWREDAARIYAYHLRQGMKGARLVMTRANSGQPYLPAVLCPDLRSAAFVFAAYRGVEVCAGCRTVFASDQERDQKYCSGACAQRRYQRQYRLREKRKRAVKKSKRRR